MFGGCGWIIFSNLIWFHSWICIFVFSLYFLYIVYLEFIVFNRAIKNMTGFCFVCLFRNCGTMSPALALYNYSSKTVINLYSHHHPVQQGTSACQFDRQNLYYLVLILLALLVLILLVLLEGRINIEKYFINNSDVWRIWTS